jgi:FkbM family methyltransferase
LRRAHELRRFYRQFVSRGSLVFDVGANVGQRAAIFRQLGAHVIAVEPQPACADRLRQLGFSVEEVAVGAESGEATLYPAAASAVASLSPEWIDRVRATDRFPGMEWGDGFAVSVTTVDALIERHGEPVFVKIDVEGYEPQVLAGLSRRVAALSFEFTPEHRDAALASIGRLRELGFERFNYALGETMLLALPDWADAAGIVSALALVPDDGVAFGDVYAL